MGEERMLTVHCAADKYESAISPPLPKPALTKEEVEELSHVIIKEYLYSSNLKVHCRAVKPTIFLMLY